MNIRLDRTGSIEGILEIFNDFSKDQSIKGLIVLACDANGFTSESIDEHLVKIEIPLFGGIFPAIIHGAEKIDKGTIVVGLAEKPDIYTIPNLSDPGMDFDGFIESVLPDSGDAKTMFVIFDGYSQQVMPMIDSIYNILGSGLNYLGGGAGSINPEALDMENTSCLITNNGLLKDSAVLALTKMEAGIGAGHGWHKISGPYKVTESHGNVINSIDLRPAFAVYREIIKEYCGKHITAENFFDIGKYFPFGVNRFESEVIVRDPFSVEGDNIIVATQIPSESFIDVLTGDPDSVVEAAGQSFSQAMENYRGYGDTTTFVIDCISRVLFLGDNFNREIEAVTKENTQLIGVLSLGEIANSGEDYMELYNKTCVVGILGEK